MWVWDLFLAHLKVRLSLCQIGKAKDLQNEFLVLIWGNLAGFILVVSWSLSASTFTAFGGLLRHCAWHNTRQTQNTVFFDVGCH